MKASMTDVLPALRALSPDRVERVDPITWRAPCPSCGGDRFTVKDVADDWLTLFCGSLCSPWDIEAELRRAGLKPTAARTSAGEPRALTFTSAADIRPERTRWLRDGRVPLGAVTLLVGKGGFGKTTMLVEDAARLTRGELPGDLFGEPRTVLFATAEDAISSTLVPRLIAAEADLERVEFVGVRERGADGLLTLPDDVDAIARGAVEHAAVLIVLDPLVAFLSGKLDSHRDQAVRRVLAPLAQLAATQTLAVIGIVHLNKGQFTDLLDKVGGSVGFGAAPRSVLAFGSDPADPEGAEGRQRVLVHAKCNVGPKQPALAYRIESRWIHGDDGERIETSRAVLLGDSTATAEDLLSTQTAEERSARDEAEEFLRVELAHGPRAFKDLAAAATSEGIAEKTLRRAKDALGVVSTKERGGQHGGWQWRLPDKVATTFQGENLGHLDHLDGNPLTEPDQDGQESQDGQKKHTGHLGAEGPSRNGWTAEAEERFIAKARQVFPGSHEEAA